MADSVCLVSCNDLSRAGLAYFLEADGFEILENQRNVASVKSLDHESDALVVVDVPDINDQILSVKHLMGKSPDAKCVILAEKFDFATMVECFNLGAHGYVVKSMRSENLIALLRLVALGEKVLPADLIDLLDRRSSLPFTGHGPDTPEEAPNLSPRELDVLCCLMAGYPNKVIARKLEVCEATVKVHVKAILRKLKVHNRTQAAIWASSHNVAEGVMAL